MSGKSDQDLLARLNALKSTPIDLDRTQATTPSPDDGDDIARRFLGLRSNTSPGVGGASSESNVTEPNEVEDINDMLKELRSQQKQTLAPGDDKRVQILLAQAQDALDQPEDDSEGSPDGRQTTNEENSHDPVRDHDERESIDEDAEAADLLAEILAEVQLDANVAQPEPESPQRADENDAADAFDETLFPTTPAKEPELPAPPTNAPLQLPSAPTAVPTKPKPKSTTKKFLDAEIETWCEICQADAEVRCLGCDGELYCMRCWKEGHTGPDVGYEERSHRCVQYSKPGPQPAAA